MRVVVRFIGSLFLGILVLDLPAPSPAGAAVATTALSPYSGARGTSVSVSGFGFPSRTRGTVSFGGSVVTTFTTSRVGSFRGSFTVPATAATGSSTVRAVAGGAAASNTFWVTGTAAAPTKAGFVGRNGRSLTLNGAPYRFTGVNSYQLTTDYAVNYGCGENNTAADVDALFASLRPNSMVRVWAFQELAWNKNTATQAFTTIDRVVAAAERANQKVILVLADQWANCGETFKTESWYAGGYKTVVNNGTVLGAAMAKLSYWNYVQAIVSRYANSPAIGMWEPVNEPSARTYSGGPCSTTAATTLRSFFDAVGGEIHRLDPNHLVSSGLQGQGQCGAVSGQYQTLHESPGIDVGSVHDWWPELAPIPGDQWNGMQVRINQMAAVNKPLFVGEVGMNASDTVPGVMTLTQRRDMFKAKMDAQYPAGIVGVIPWYRSKVVSELNYKIADNDPTLALLHDYPL